MSTYSKHFLSESTNGRGILVATTTSPGTTIHNAVAGSVDMDEVWIYAVNLDSSTRTLYLQWGGVSSEDIVNVNVDPSEGLRAIIPGFPLNNSVVVSAYASVSDKITIHGFVNRIEA